MKRKYLQINFDAKVKPIKPVNDEFTLCKAYVQGIGKNRNGSYMSKENVEKYIATLNYCPVVGHIIEATNSKTGESYKYMGGHDRAFDENWNLIDLTVPYGVVVNDTFDYEIINEYGSDVEYLTAQVILWTGRYPELKEAIYSDDFWFNQSMEINPVQYRPLEEDSNYIELLEWNYSALCLLGKADDKNSPEHTEPCFINASVIPIEFSANEFKKDLEELKVKLSYCYTNNDDKGGKTELDEKMKILQKFNKSIDDLDFSIDDMSVEDLNNKMEELFGEKEPQAENEPIAFSATYKEKRNALQDALVPTIVRDTEGNYVEETYFYLEDFSDEYAFVEKDHWTKDAYECKYGRFSYKFDEASMAVTLTGEFEEMVKVWLTLDEKTKLDEDRASFEALKIEYAEYKELHSTDNAEVEKLMSYKASSEAEKIFSKFEDKLGETSEFSNLKKNFKDYSLSELEKECIYIVGLHASELNFNKVSNDSNGQDNKSLKFSVEPPNNIDEPYGGLMKKYLKK